MPISVISFLLSKPLLEEETTTAAPVVVARASAAAAGASAAANAVHVGVAPSAADSVLPAYAVEAVALMA